jgi:CRP-like cAMP-binding protein
MLYTESLMKLGGIFAGVEPDELARVSWMFGERSAGPGERLVRQGDCAYEIYFVHQGVVYVERDGGQVAVLRPGSVFGEIGVMHKRPRTASVAAGRRARVLTISHWDLRRMRRAAPSLVQRLAALAEQRQPASSRAGNGGPT